MEWVGNPVFTVGLSPNDKELLQLRSERMYLSVPEYVVGLFSVPGYYEVHISCSSLAKFDPSSSAEATAQTEKLDPFGNPHLSTRSGRGESGC